MCFRYATVDYRLASHLNRSISSILLGQCTAKLKKRLRLSVPEGNGLAGGLLIGLSDPVCGQDCLCIEVVFCFLSRQPQLSQSSRAFHSNDRSW